MKQRLLAGLLAVVLVLGLAPAALAAAPAEGEAAQVLAALDIMVGDESGNLNLGATVTRAEFTKLAVAASTSRDAVGDTVSVKPYPDVPQSHWAAPYIKAAVDLGLVQGDLHGNFNPGRSITLAEGVTIVLRLLGYQDSDFTGVWPSGQMAQYRALKLNEGVTAGQDSAMTRRDALYLFYNLMITKNKEGSYYLNVLEPTLSLVNAAGELDRVALINSAMEGPVVAAAGWQSSVPFDAGSATVYRNGAKSSLAAVQNQDVVYWSESMHTLWAYSDKITGTYEAASPSVTSPTSVTVAGKSYTIEAPYHALTNAGHISYIEMDGDPTDNLEAFEKVIRCMKESGIGYGSVNHPVDRDPVCGFSGIIGDQCPGCGRTEADGVPFERIRRITGYLVGTLDRFNNGKRAEERDRVKHSV